MVFTSKREGRETMYARFNDAEKAASYLASGLQKDFPDATAEVTFSAGRRHHSTTCTIPHIGPILQQMCQRFPLASVDYHPENRYGFVGEIRCHGEGKQSTVFERHSSSRPRVVVMLTRVHDEDTLVGSASVVPNSTGFGGGSDVR
jgi:hypothetical protein